jgi:hypothetical protein
MKIYGPETRVYSTVHEFSGSLLESFIISYTGHLVSCVLLSIGVQGRGDIRASDRFISDSLLTAFLRSSCDALLPSL